ARSAAQRRARHESRAPARGCAGPLAQISAQELLGILDEELLALPDRYRLPLVLCYLEGATRDEAARQIGCPPATVKSRLERGRDRLQQALRRRGLTLAGALSAAAVSSSALGRESVRTVLQHISGGVPAMALSKLRMALAALVFCGVFSGVAVWVS